MILSFGCDLVLLGDPLLDFDVDFMQERYGSVRNFLALFFVDWCVVMGGRHGSGVYRGEEGRSKEKLAGRQFD